MDMWLNSFYKKSYHREILDRLLFQYRSFLHGEILDVGSKNRRYDHLFHGHITAIDLIPDPDRNVLFGDIEKGLSFSGGSFDGVLCIEVFEYFDDYEYAISEIQRMLRPGGKVIVSLPFFWHDHGDTIRFTKSFFLAKLKKYFSIVHVSHIGDATTAIYDILRYRILHLKSRIIRGVLTICILLPYCVFLRMTESIRKEDTMYSGLFILLEKSI